MIVTSKENNQVSANLKDNLSEFMNGRGISRSYLPSVLSKITNREHNNQFKIAKDPQSNRVNDHLMKKRNQLLYITIWLY